MESACIRHTDLPGTSKLFADFNYHFDRVARFYPHNPHDPASFAAAAAEINYPAERRAAIVAALRAQNGDSESLQRLAQPDAVAVVTGQQVCLFGGGALTIYKALTAVRLARELSQRHIPAVPIFWLATEDHDFLETNHSWSFDSAGAPVKLEMDNPYSDGRQRAVGPIPLNNPPLAELRRSLAGSPYGEEVAALAESAYRPGATMAEAFRALLQKLFEGTGLLILDPLDPRIRAIAAPFLADALSAAPDLKARLLDRNQQLAAAGYHAQVHVEPKTSLFFLLENGERVTQRRKDSEFADLRDRAAEISPNALLRPVMQDYLLPTVAYLGGPAELAYFGQAGVLYETLLGRMPVVMSRSSLTLLDSRAHKLLARYKLSVTDTLVDQDALTERLAAALVPTTLERTFDDVQRGTERQLDQLGAEIERFDKTLADALSRSRAKILYQLDKLRRKTARETLRRDARAGADARYLHNLIYPHRHMQERFYSILPFVARHGLDLVERLHGALELSCPDHRVLTL